MIKGNFSKVLDSYFSKHTYTSEFSTELWNAEISYFILLKVDFTTEALPAIL